MSDAAMNQRLGIQELDDFNTSKNAEAREALKKTIEKYLVDLEDFEFRCERTENRKALLAEITALNDAMLRACAEFENTVDGDEALIREAQADFREKTGPILLKSHFINHARTWPYGYQGDFQMLEGVYRSTPLATGIGYYLDAYSLATTLGNAVRERRTTLRGLLKTELEHRHEPRVLDIACGSCREVFELAEDIKKAAAGITAVDFDPNALSFASDRMLYAGLSSEQVKFHKYNAIKMVNHDRNLQVFGRHDVIYSVGFFDYLDDAVLVRLLRSLFDLLNPGGKLITSFKDCRRYDTQYYHWMVDWNGFFQRTEEMCEELLQEAGIPADAVTSLRDSSGVILFYSATRSA